MKALIFGASGMVGQGVLRECLTAHDVHQVVTAGRTSLAQTHPKLQQLILADLMQLDTQARELQGVDACFFCLGVSSSGMTEDAYAQVTHTLTLHVARLLAQLNPNMTFTYVSGTGTDSSEQGTSMWARIKGKTENDLQKLPFQSVYLFRPGIIQPLDGIQSKTQLYQWFYRVTNPFLSLIQRFAPNAIVTTADVGQAMLNAARQNKGRVVVEAKDIIALAQQQG